MSKKTKQKLSKSDIEEILSSKKGQVSTLLSLPETVTILANEPNIGITEEALSNQLGKISTLAPLQGEIKQLAKELNIEDITSDSLNWCPSHQAMRKTFEKSEANKKIAQKLPIPLQDRILVTKTKDEEVSKGGIIMPATAIQDNKTGVVVAVGPLVGVKTYADLKDSDLTFPTNSTPVKPGDLVQFGEYAGVEVEYNDTKYLIMREADILCILP
ncbi:MAG: co-chaperone GroES [Nanoarchaeota archaeon]